jgi:hypothetical protein
MRDAVETVARMRPQPPAGSALAVAAIVTSVLSATCHGPAAPSPPHGDASPPHGSGFTLSGRVIGTVTGEPIGHATVTLPGTTVVTNADGTFALTETVSDIRQVVVTGDGLIARTSRLSVGARDVTIDVIQNRVPFDLGFYRRLARNAFEAEGDSLEPLRPIRTAPRIHIRTVDEANRPIDAATLDLVESALRDAAPIWSAGKLPIATIERGSGSRVGQEGWITLRWMIEEEGETCGRATLGTTTGFIEIQYRNPDCHCGSLDDVAPRTIRHELGHVYGYWHTGENRDVMSGIPWPRRLCNQTPSSREVEHSKYMYSRLPGNLDPDTDPAGGQILDHRPVIIIIDD